MSSGPQIPTTFTGSCSKRTPGSPDYSGDDRIRFIGVVPAAGESWVAPRPRSGRSRCFHGLPQLGVGALGNAGQGGQAVQDDRLLARDLGVENVGRYD